jgi:hypothetical protein
MEEASLVFRGVVLERKILPQRAEMKGRGRYAITFRVDEYWKGSPAASLVVYGMDGGTDCQDGGEYQVGKGYLVYAFQTAATDMWPEGHFWYGWTDILPEGTRMLVPLTACMPGGEIRAVKRALRQLGKGRIPLNR